MKIDIGMYCYNKTNRKLGIGKIISFQCNNNVNIRYKNDIELVSIGNVIASFNIIDILEVGDIISFYEDIDNYKKQYVIGIPDLITLDEIKDKIINDNIRLVNILTKQEMEQMAYKVGE